MDSKGPIIASAWIAIAIISAMFIYVGGVNLSNYIAVALLVLVAFMLTFAVGFGLEGMKRYGPPSKTQLATIEELKEMKTTIDELAKKIDAIQKELQE